MQEVFEKIIENLEKEIKKQFDPVNQLETDEIGIWCFDRAKEIVTQVADEYNNGWNDRVEKGLPPVGKPLIVTIEDSLQGKPNEIRYPVYYEQDSMKSGYRWNWRYGDFVYELLPEVSEIIAWQPIPEPYHRMRGK